MNRPRKFVLRMPNNELAIENIKINCILSGGKITEEAENNSSSADDDEKKIWVVGVGGSIGDTVSVYRVYGDKRQVKRFMLRLIKSDKRENIECWDYGTDKLSDIEEDHFGDALYGYGVWSDYHLDYTANPEPEIEVL